jgi:hypothetical protein
MVLSFNRGLISGSSFRVSGSWSPRRMPNAPACALISFSSIGGRLLPGSAESIGPFTISDGKPSPSGAIQQANFPVALNKGSLRARRNAMRQYASLPVMYQIA